MTGTFCGGVHAARTSGLPPTCRYGVTGCLVSTQQLFGGGAIAMREREASLFPALFPLVGVTCIQV